jgi:hypothetical protein
MAFMSYEITNKQNWWQVEDNGKNFYPCAYFTREAVAKMHQIDLADEDEAEQIEQINGYGARLSAPGYLDCTEWSVYQTRAEAKAALDEMYGEDEADEADEADGADDEPACEAALGC